tara:strand:- start:1021 stop:1281 length:261 start_codon:yes stop_codon:yes gene_type:complete
MIVVRCKQCNKEVSGHTSRARSCGCPNMTTVIGDSLTAVDLTKVIMIKSGKDAFSDKKQSLFSPQELQFQEERRKRKVRKLDFEIR